MIDVVTNSAQIRPHNLIIVFLSECNINFYSLSDPYLNFIFHSIAARIPVDLLAWQLSSSLSLTAPPLKSCCCPTSQVMVVEWISGPMCSPSPRPWPSSLSSPSLSRRSEEQNVNI